MFSGDLLAAARVAAGLTQTQLAEAIGTTQGRVSDWERGVSTPRASYIPRIAGAVDVDALALMGPTVANLTLEALRMAAGLSVTELALAVGISAAWYHRLERGDRAGEPPSDLLKTLAVVLAVPTVTVAAAVEAARDQARLRRQGGLHHDRGHIA